MVETTKTISDLTATERQQISRAFSEARANIITRSRTKGNQQTRDFALGQLSEAQQRFQRGEITVGAIGGFGSAGQQAAFNIQKITTFRKDPRKEARAEQDRFGGGRIGTQGFESQLGQQDGQRLQDTRERIEQQLREQAGQAPITQTAEQRFSVGAGFRQPTTEQPLRAERTPVSQASGFFSNLFQRPQTQVDPEVLRLRAAQAQQPRPTQFQQLFRQRQAAQPERTAIGEFSEQQLEPLLIERVPQRIREGRQQQQARLEEAFGIRAAKVIGAPARVIETQTALGSEFVGRQARQFRQTPALIPISAFGGAAVTGVLRGGLAVAARSPRAFKALATPVGSRVIKFTKVAVPTAVAGVEGFRIATAPTKEARRQIIFGETPQVLTGTLLGGAAVSKAFPRQPAQAIEVAEAIGGRRVIEKEGVVRPANILDRIFRRKQIEKISPERARLTREVVTQTLREQKLIGAPPRPVIIPRDIPATQRRTLQRRLRRERFIVFGSRGAEAQLPREFVRQPKDIDIAIGRQVKTAPNILGVDVKPIETLEVFPVRPFGKIPTVRTPTGERVEALSVQAARKGFGTVQRGRAFRGKSEFDKELEDVKNIFKFAQKQAPTAERRAAIRAAERLQKLQPKQPLETRLTQRARPPIKPSRIIRLVDRPSVIPSRVPSRVPSIIPSRVPSSFISRVPSKPPSIIPSRPPSSPISRPPSKPPSLVPSIQPSPSPSILPSISPSPRPSISPTFVPSSFISVLPKRPSFVPAKLPTTNILGAIGRGARGRFARRGRKRPKPRPSVLAIERQIVSPTRKRPKGELSGGLRLRTLTARQAKQVERFRLGTLPRRSPFAQLTTRKVSP